MDALAFVEEGRQEFVADLLVKLHVHVEMLGAYPLQVALHADDVVAYPQSCFLAAANPDRTALTMRPLPGSICRPRLSGDGQLTGDQHFNRV